MRESADPHRRIPLARIDRTDFGLRWNMPSEGGGLVVGNKVEIELEVEAVAAAAKAA